MSLQRIRALFKRAKVAPLARAEAQPAAAAACRRRPKRGAEDVILAFLAAKEKGPQQELCFLRAVRRVCHIREWERKTTLPFPKEEVAAKIRDIMLKSFMGLEPRFILSMEAVADLSKFHPPLEPNVQRSIVAWALGMVLGGPPIGSDPAGQALQQEGEEALRRLLRGLIREDPSSGHLFTLLDQLLYWHRVRWPAPRARACALITDLLAATKMPGWNITERDQYGHLVAKLSVSLADPEAEVREKAREVIGQLLRLQQKEQGRSKKTISWEEDPERPWMESYAHLIAAAEVFGGHLSERQRLSFQEAALEDALSLDGRWVREGGLLVLLSLLGQARALLEEEEIEDLRSNLSALLYNIWRGREVPPEIAALLPSSDE
ncbi:uncharacterized protein LOC143824763 [Paroedura picta]|uniref:uncharacterized protein LOC143824763 n=1 Tax=Paroedura picta TaxID=143630 RepID=UPI004056C92A